MVNNMIEVRETPVRTSSLQMVKAILSAMVFGELTSADRSHLLLVVFGSVLMILGALSISAALSSSNANLSRNRALENECIRYGIDYQQALLAQSGIETGERTGRPRWWDMAILAGAAGIFVWLGWQATVPPLLMNLHWVFILASLLVIALVCGGWALWRQTRFS